MNFMEKELQVGDMAPDFTAYNQDEEKVILSEIKNKWIVLYFYPKDNTSGCTQEALDFTEYKAEFEKCGAEIYGMSKDSIKSHKNFIIKNTLTVKLLSDETTDNIKNYCAWGTKKMYGKEYEGIIRSTYLISPDKKIAAIWKNVKVKNHVQEVLEKLKNEIKKA